MYRMDYKLHFIVACLLTTVLCNNHPTVNTNYGSVRGVLDESGSVTKFLGIPFAKPPIGPLRLMKPVKPDSWTETIDAFEYRPSCIENSLVITFLVDLFNMFPKYETSEDCLFLNIFVPDDFKVTNNEKKAVLFYIFGGGYSIGSSNFYPGATLADRENVIVVTFNYRVGLFGFAATEDELIPGNMGLFDQHAALTWVNENIASFGGDASRITIFGQSAGADSVLNHLASPLSKDLFFGGISLSPPNMPTLTKLNSRKVQHTKLLDIAKPKCGTSPDSKALLTCLQSLSADELNHIINDHVFHYEYVIVDGEFLPDNPSKIFASGNFDKSKIITVGFTGDDGDVILQSRNQWNDLIQNGITMDDAIQLLPMTLGMRYADMQLAMGSVPISSVMKDLIFREYLRGKDKDVFEVGRDVIDIFTDALFKSKCFDIADAVSKFGGTVYVYAFDHLTESLNASLKSNIKLSAGHGHDIFYQFLGTSYPSSLEGNIPITDAERQLSASVMKATAEFARTGKPVFLTENNKEVKWEPYTSEKPNYLQFTTHMTEKSIQQVPQKQMDRMSLWNSILMQIYELSEQVKVCSETCSEGHDLYGEDQQINHD